MLFHRDRPQCGFGYEQIQLTRFMNLAASHSILVQVKSQTEAERIIGLCRDAFTTIRAHRITSENDLLEHIKDAENWQLLITDNLHPEVSLPYALDTLKAHDVDLPVLLMANSMPDEAKKQALQLGVCDIVEKEDDGLLLHAADREIHNTLARRQAKSLQAALNELQERADKLMSDTDDAIAYVADGILIESNQQFAEAFGYNSHEDLDCASMIDLVCDDDQETFKAFLRAFSKGEIDKNSLGFSALKNDDDTFNALIHLSQTSLDGEPCIQINLAATNPNDTEAAASTDDAATGLPNRYALIEALKIAALQHAGKATLALFAIDDFDKHEGELQLSGCDALIKDLASEISKTLTVESIGRVGDDKIAALCLKQPEKVLPESEKLLEALDQHISDIQGRSVQYSCSIALMKLPNIEPAVLLDNAVSGLYDIRRQKGKNAVDIYTPLEKKPSKQAVSSQDSFDDIVASGAMQIMYQPIMSLHGDEVENYEVTVDIFKPELLDGMDLNKLDRWCLIESTKALAAHITNGHNTRLLINLSQAALLDESLAPWVKVALKAANLKPGSVTLQFAEEDVKNHLKQAAGNFGIFKAQQVPVSINRFGDESEPDKLLKHVSPDFLRFTPALTELLTNGEDTTPLKKLLSQVNEMGIKTILPDIQNASSLATCWQLGTHYIQGAYLQLPTPEMNYEFAELG
ncbi:Phytochrome-like protein cph2 [BD1-7 clade bacterium]|uniref:Phytochrome-like protein cph2 n=1 Tax=BD1-7 clade bacterium TaxID=2029982 RepID=A0A5S9MYW9_9GAMM|nr:Phytochrome-like protein cph2 [BD1-7 clade bacterium]